MNDPVESVALQTAASHPNLHSSRLEGRRIGFFGLNWLIVFLITGGFSLLTPVYGGPDEVAHTVYAWAAVSSQLPLKSDVVEGPAYLGMVHPGCWVFGEQLSAECQGSMDATATDSVELSTSAFGYPPLYYYLVGWPLLLGSGASVFYAARLISALLFSLFIAVGITAFTWGQGHRWTFGAGLIACITPTAFAMGSYINPQALEIGSAIAFWGIILPLVRNLDPMESRVRLIAAGIVGMVFIQARPIGPYWLVFLLITLVLALGKERAHVLAKLKSSWVFLAMLLVSSGFWIGWLVIAPNSSSNISNPADCKITCAVQTTFTSTLEWLNQSIAVGGWLSARPVSLLVVVYLVFFLGVVFAALVVGERRKRWALLTGFVMLAFSVIPIEYMTVYSGTMWQGRYGLPLLIPLIILGFEILAERGLGSQAANLRVCRIGVSVWSALVLGFAVRSAYRFWVGIGSGSYWNVFRSAPYYSLIGVVSVSVTAVVFWISVMTRKIDHKERRVGRHS